MGAPAFVLDCALVSTLTSTLAGIFATDISGCTNLVTPLPSSCGESNGQAQSHSVKSR